MTLIVRRVIGRLLGRPLPWDAMKCAKASARPETVDIVIPVFGAAAELERCLRSIEAETNLGRHRVTLVIDGDQAPAVDAVVDSFRSRHPAACNLIRNAIRRGFVVSANAGMRASSSDVVLLNSDTVVTPRWLEKLIDAGASSSNVGTVTPLSNAATLCSVPRAFEENLLPTGFDVVSFAALVERVSAREYPRIPTGVGFCLYVKRALIDEIGLFDEARFGLGYGEENDFCFRALKRGWVHIADDATFVYHASHQSFGNVNSSLRRRGAAMLDRLHPEYTPTVASFMEADPMADVRGRILDAVRARGVHGSSSITNNRVVHVVHGWPPYARGGAEMYAYWLARHQLRWRDVSVYARRGDSAHCYGEAVELEDDGVRVRLVTNNFSQRSPLSRNALRSPLLERDFRRFLESEKPALVHIHHLAGHAFSLLRVARALRLPVVHQLQDWWSVCARVNLFDSQWRRCSGPGLLKCSRCAPLTRIRPRRVWSAALHAYRRYTVRRGFSACDAFVMGSAAVRRDFERAGLLSDGSRTHVIPYGVELERSGGVRPPVRKPIRFGYVGSILPHKGIHVAVEAFRTVDPRDGELHIWGDSGSPASREYVERLEAISGSAAVSFEGSFAEERKRDIFESMDVFLAPSVGLESFGLAAREALACGVPVVAADDGALREMFPANESAGRLFPSGDARALAAILHELIASPEIVDRWSASVPAQHSAAEHAEEIEQVYAEVLGRRWR